ncbi:glycosyltransferase family 8 protein [Aliiroseovarius sp.]|uniref:glycosyltransferase family 8 protein n=1 Tax=Aliiroseovarius sp. TaxID=1872442 RepID=UPI003BAA1897
MTEVTDNQPAQHRHCVLMACDAGYYPFATLLASQIAQAFPARNFDICILSHQDLPKLPLCDALNLRMLRFDMPEDWQVLATDKKITLAAYQRVVAPRLLAADYDRILYLDSDIIYERGDIAALLALDLGGRPVAAVRNNSQIRKPNRYQPEYKAAGLPHAPYFNSGVMLIDVSAYLEQEIEAKTMDFARTDNEVMRRKHDQSALNLALHDNWAELGPVWNWPSFHRFFFFTHFIDPCLVHFMSSRKPWRDTNGIYAARHVAIYTRHLQEHFPELAAQMPDRPPMGSRRWTWIALYLLHAIDFRRMGRYISGFTSDLQLK